MDKVPSPDKLKWLTMVLSAATIGCMLVASILEGPAFGSYIIPAALALIYSLIPEDMRV